jgi:hypothetical protein
VDDADVRAYVQRRWSAAQALKREHWAHQLENDPLATFMASQALWVHMRQVNPDWPTDAERRDDFAHHVELKRAIDRAARVVLAATRR